MKVKKLHTYWKSTLFFNIDLNLCIDALIVIKNTLFDITDYCLLLL